MSEIDGEPQSLSKVRSYWKGRYNLVDVPASQGIQSSQARLRVRQRNRFEKIDLVLETCGFESLGDFLAALFYCHSRNSKDPDP